MQEDPFSGSPSCIQGRQLPSPSERSRLQHDHERRLEALDRLGQAAENCGLRADSDGNLVLYAEDEVSLLEAAGHPWTDLGDAIRAFRVCLPLMPLETFGFPADSENPLEEPNALMRRIGGGVEAWAFAAESDGSVYKFFRPREGDTIGSAFGFRRGEEAWFNAEARLGTYRQLLEKLLLIHALGGMACEVVAVTYEGILVAKQVLGDPLPQGDDVSRVLPTDLIEIPSRFLRANRDHPRLFWQGGRAWLVGDLHARNFVRGIDGGLHVIDLVAARWPEEAGNPLIADWLERVRSDPHASLLREGNDDEL
ncbi:hypothetical protein CMV30_14670 [Nibricoccus aquaticus]|uniref:Uncharacterized protein n=1 Tax=Nibricoccus aquaticus TaxID=2576891 RepID=A0A290QA11_9BACT|nr:hypothetical protein [Nibricoccus aquaticus]ATC65097.1 hypothetical protein CMV30_14670 [Nibricoccus aquaticus]